MNPEAGMAYQSRHGIIREPSKPIRWSYRFKHKTSEHEQISLEEEIFRLRILMEQSYLENQSLTAYDVVEISRMLDEKINEYMRKSR